VLKTLCWDWCVVCDVKVVSEGSGLTYWSGKIMPHVDMLFIESPIWLFKKASFGIINGTDHQQQALQV